MGSAPLTRLEAAYLAARDARDRLDVARARGEPADTGPLEAEATETERRAHAALAAFDPTPGVDRSPAAPDETLDAEDRRALTAIRAGMTAALGNEGALPVTPSCTLAECDDPEAWSAAFAVGGTALRQRTEACYATVARAIHVGGETLNRLQVLARLSAEPDEARRRDLFLALRPLWRMVDGDQAADAGGSADPGRTAVGPSRSPYAALVRESAAAWRAGRSPITANAAALRVPETEIEAWVLAILDAWRIAIVEPDRASGRPPIEPWSWWWRAASIGRARTDLLSRDAILAVNRAVYASLGADLDALNVVLDVTPRPSRPVVPVAFTTFGGRPHARPGGGWWRGRPTVLATYVDGGIDELAELVHETGHAIHLAAIHTRPAFTDWPASDALTEAIADLVAHDVTDVAWQRRWLADGGAASPTDVGGGPTAASPGVGGGPTAASPGVGGGPTAASVGAREDAPARHRDTVRARHSQTVLDAAWTLLEVRQHADPDRPASDIWAEITSAWLGLTPHPEWSWWAMRGQLIQEPGYMANYTIGAVLAADLRTAIREARGSWIDGDPGWYDWVSDHLYRFGLERSPAEVLGDLLGRAPTADALLAEIIGARAPA